MLAKPSSCNGCPLFMEGDGFMKPSFAGPNAYRVALVGEALGADEAEVGAPFVGAAGFKLTRLIEWAGLDRAKFDIWNVAWCRPPNNKLEGTYYELGATKHCQDAHWGSLIGRVNVVVPMGNVALGAFTGQKGILQARGYVQPGPGTSYLLPTVHPSFIQRGQSKYSAAFILDIQKAVELASVGLQPVVKDYILDPPPGVAMAWAREYRARLEGMAPESELVSGLSGLGTGHVGYRPRYLAFDIETPGKGDDEGELDGELDTTDRTYKILRIGFSYRSGSGISFPFEPAYYAAIRLLLESEGDKVVWNAGFDVPRLRNAGFSINGTIHDGMVAWHILHSDLPKGLGFVATFTCPWQPRWKHLSGAQPAFYNATDADVELTSMEVIEAELRKAGMWYVYEQDVIRLDPILRYMETVGMPVDPNVRLEKALELAERQTDIYQQMTALIPEAARRVDHVYKTDPPVDLIPTLLSRPSTRTVNVCKVCGAVKPPKSHFRVLKKKVNPCADAGTRQATIPVTEYYRLAPFKPSRDQLIRYHEVMGRPIPTTMDKKTRQRKPSFDEKSIRTLTGKYPDDKLYSLILDYREADKLAGTYIGRPAIEGDLP